MEKEKRVKCEAIREGTTVSIFENGICVRKHEFRDESTAEIFWRMYSPKEIQGA